MRDVRCGDRTLHVRPLGSLDEREGFQYLALTAVTLGGYATYRLYAGMWAGYHEQAADGTKMGVIGAINSLNPLYAIIKGGAETYRAAAKGDFEAAGEKGVVTAIITAVTVVGVIQGLGSLGASRHLGLEQLREQDRQRRARQMLPKEQRRAPTPWRSKRPSLRLERVLVEHTSKLQTKLFSPR